MNTTRLRQVRALYRNDLAPRSTVRHNIRAWTRSVRMLGSQWLYAQPIRLVRKD